MSSDDIVINVVLNTETTKAGFKDVENQAVKTSAVTTQAFNEFNKANQQADTGIKQTATTLQDLNKVVANGAMKEMAKDAADVAVKHVTLRGQVMALKQGLVELAEQGKKGTTAWNEQKAALEKAATSLRELNKLTANLGNQTKTFAGLIDAARGVAAGFEIAKGATVLFGSENKKAEEAIKELVSVMAVLNGLQEIQLLLKEDSAAMQLILNGQELAGAAAVKLQTAAESENIIVNKAATAAQWALNAAMEANPIMLLVGAIGAVVAAFIYFTSEAKDAKKAQEELNAAQAEAIKYFNEKNALQKQAGAIAVSEIDKEIVKAKERNATMQEIHELERKRDLQKIENANQLYLANKKLADQLKDPAQRGAAIDELAAKEKHLAEIQIDSHAVYVKNAEGRNVKREDEIKLEEEKIKQQKDLLAIGLNVLSQQDEAYKEYHTNEKQRIKDEADYDINNAIKRLEIKRNLALEGSRQDLALFAEIQHKKYELAKVNGESPEGLKILLAQQYQEYESYYGKVLKLRADQIKANEQQNLSNESEELNFIREHEKHKEEIKRAFESMSFEEFKQWEEKRRDEFKATDDWEKMLDDEALRHKKELANIEMEQEKAVAQAKIEAEKQAVQEIFKLAVEVEQAIFTIKKNNRDAELAADLSMFEQRKEKELSNKHLTAEQTDAINRKYRRIEADAKLKAWKADQKAAETQAAIKMALGVVNAWATSSSWIQALIVTAAVIAAGSAEIAVIASQKPPQFAKGTEYVERGNAPAGTDTIHAMVNEGERIVPTHINQKLKGISNEDLPKLVANYSPPMPHAPELSDARIIIAQNGIDYDKLGTVIAEKLRANPQTVVNIDKNGFAINIIEKQMRIEKYNNRFKTS